MGAVQDNGLFLRAIDLEEAVGRGSGELIDEYLAAGVVHRDLVAVHGDIAIAVTRYGGIGRFGVADLDPALESRRRDVVVGRGIAGGFKRERAVAALAAGGGQNRQDIRIAGRRIGLVLCRSGRNQGGAVAYKRDGTVSVNGGYFGMRRGITDIYLIAVRKRRETVLLTEGGLE